MSARRLSDARAALAGVGLDDDALELLAEALAPRIARALRELPADPVADAIADRVAERLVDRLAPAISDRVAERLVDRLAPAISAPDLIDAVEVARILSVSRWTVYQRADEWGAIRLGDRSDSAGHGGPRLRFDRQVVLEVLAARSARSAGERSEVENANGDGGPGPAAGGARRRTGRSTAAKPGRVLANRGRS